MISEYGYSHNPRVLLIREYDYYHSHLRVMGYRLIREYGYTHYPRVMHYRLENMGIIVIQGC